MNYICRLVRKAQPMGEYKPTAIDAAKDAADFRLIAVGKKNTIAKLQASHTWATDF